MKKSNAFFLLLASSALFSCSQGSDLSSFSSTIAHSSSETISSNSATSSETTAVSSSSKEVDEIAIPTGDAVDVSATKTLLSATLAKMDAISDMRLSLKGDLSISMMRQVETTTSHVSPDSESSSSENSSYVSNFALEVKDLNANLSAKNLNKDGFAASGEATAHAKFNYETVNCYGTSSYTQTNPFSGLDQDVYGKAYIDEGVGYFDVSPVLAPMITGESTSSENIHNKFKADIAIPQFSWTLIMQGIAYADQINQTVSAVKKEDVYSLIYSVPCKSLAMLGGSYATFSSDSKFEGSIKVAVSFDENKLLDVVAISDIDADYTKTQSNGNFESIVDVGNFESIVDVDESIVGAIKASLSYNDVSVTSVSNPDDYYETNQKGQDSRMSSL